MRAVRATAALVVAVFAVIASGCSSSPTRAPAPAERDISFNADYSGQGPGSLRSAVTLPTVDRRLIKVSSVAARVTYESRSFYNDRPVLVSGVVFAPNGAPPDGGWPIIAFGHGTTGVQHPCAPSLSDSLLGSADAVATLVKDGYVVAMTDYQGLGLDQQWHPYLEPVTAAYNLIDAVRAARALVPNTSDRWLAYGPSQGGQASWAANELAASYGAGMQLVGSVSIAPASDISAMADAAAAGTLTLEQAVVLPWMLESISRFNPDFAIDDFRHGLVLDRWDVFTACDGPLAAERAELAKQVTPDDLRPTTPQDAAILRGHLAAMRLPQGRSTAPMLVIFGADDQLVAPAWTIEAVRRACERGSPIEAYLAPNRGHDDIDASTAVQWIKERFTDTPILNTCESPEGPVTVLADRPWYVDAGR